MAHWLASLGGFLSHTPPDWNSPTYSPIADDSMNAGVTNGGSGSNNESRYSSIDADFGPDQSFMSNVSSSALPETGTNQEGKSPAQSFQLEWKLTNIRSSVNTRRPAEQPQYDMKPHFDMKPQYDMSFSFEYDMGTSQQEPNHDDSGIGLLEDGIDAQFANKIQSLKSHLSQTPVTQRVS